MTIQVGNDSLTKPAVSVVSERGLSPSWRRASFSRCRHQRINLVPSCLGIEHMLEFFQLLRIPTGQVVRLAIVLRQVVKFPFALRKVLLVVLGEDFPWEEVAGTGPPAIFVDAAIAQHLEVLQRAAAGRIGVVD